MFKIADCWPRRRESFLLVFKTRQDHLRQRKSDVTNPWLIQQASAFTAHPRISAQKEKKKKGGGGKKLDFYVCPLLCICTILTDVFKGNDDGFEFPAEHVIWWQALLKYRDTCRFLKDCRCGQKRTVELTIGGRVAGLALQLQSKALDRPGFAGNIVPVYQFSIFRVMVAFAATHGKNPVQKEYVYGNSIEDFRYLSHF